MFGSWIVVEGVDGVLYAPTLVLTAHGMVLA